MKEIKRWFCYSIISGFLPLIASACTVGDDGRATITGEHIYNLVLNLNDTAQCTGHLKSLQYIWFQGPRINNSNRDFTLSVSVWSPASSTSQYNLRGSRDFSKRANGSPTRLTSGTLNFNPPLLIKERDAIGLYVAEPQEDDRIVSFVGDGSDSLCLSAISAGTINCSSTAIVSEKLLRAHATITPITCPVPSLPNGRVLQSPSGPFIISPLLINTVIHYQCNNGWFLHGERSGQCVLTGESGVLNGTVPTCIRTNPGGNALTTSSSKLPSIFSSTTSSNSIKAITSRASTTTSSTILLSTTSIALVTPSATISKTHITSISTGFSSAPTVLTTMRTGILLAATVIAAVFMLGLLALAIIIVVSVALISKRSRSRSRSRRRENAIENPLSNIDALYVTAQKPTSTNRTNQTKTNTQFAVEHPSGSGSRNATEYYYETPVPVTRCHLQQYHASKPQEGYEYPAQYELPLSSTAESYSKLEQKKQYHKNLKQVEKKHVKQYVPPAKDEDQLYMQLCHARNIKSESLTLEKQLGSGQFGEVYKGRWGDKMVAVKQMKTGSSHEERVKFLQEAAIMAQFDNVNVVKMHGIVYQRNKPMIVMELLGKGDLLNYLIDLRISNNISPFLLLNFCRQICLGMTYLSGKGFIHRDLAARNVLLSDKNTCKIADFGMSRDLEEEGYYYARGGKVPIKWTAPEAIINRKYSSASDMWSYGCVMYEIWSLGRKPFEDYSNIYAIEKVKDGYRLPPPPGCPRSIYKYMIQCWHPVPRERPDFQNLMLSLLQIETMEDDSFAGIACQLGGDLAAGEDLHTDLQHMYKK